MKYSWLQWNTTPRILLYRWLSHQRPISWIPQLHHNLGCSLLTDVSRTSWVFPLQKWCPSWLWSFQEVFHLVHQLCYIASTCSAKLTFDLCIMQLNIVGDTHISPGDTIQGQVSATIHLVSTPCTEIQGSLGFSCFHAMDSRSQVLNSGFFVTETIIRGILDSLSCIPNSKAQYSRLHSKNVLILDSTSKNLPDSGIWIVTYMGWFVWHENLKKKIFVPNTQFFFCITSRTNSRKSGLHTFLGCSALILQTFCRHLQKICWYNL